MSFLSILDGILLKPLMLLFEVIFVVAARITRNAGLSIFLLSMSMNLLVLPLYRRSDMLQEEERQIQEKLRAGVNHIKKTFKGDERMMILQTYYRQNHYKPAYALRGSISLLLQIPFFLAAYRYLSTLRLLENVPMGFIADLAKPDGALTIAGLTINVLPIIMTGVNLISCVIYTKESPLKSKLQLYGMALFFLFFLYDSSAGLVFYWTLNNLFSLAKTILYKLKNPKRVIGGIASVVGVAVLVYALAFMKTPDILRRVGLIGCGVLLQIPIALPLLRRKFPAKCNSGADKSSSAAFLTGAMFLALLTGALIPSSVIKASPLDFVNVNMYYNPLWYVVSSICMSMGVFIVWGGIFYRLASVKGRVLMERIVWLLCGCFAATYLFFGRDMGIISASLVYDNGWSLSAREKLINIVVIAVIIVLFTFIFKRWRRRATEIMAIGAAALLCLSCVNVVGISNEIGTAAIADNVNQEDVCIPLSKNGKNVVTIMLDRAMNKYIPYILQEKPELKEMYDGFTFYPNTISYGACTIFGAAPLWGGYEYTPVEMNKRDTELLKDKHYEALKVLPVLFLQNDYQVTVFDAPTSVYQAEPGFSLYGDYPDIKTATTDGMFTNADFNEETITGNQRNFFCFAITKCMPLVLQRSLYEDGRYNCSEFVHQVVKGTSVAQGLDPYAVNAYTALERMNQLTQVSDGTGNTYFMMTNYTTHDPMLYQTPNYVMSKYVNNTEYDQQHADRFMLNGEMHTITDAEVFKYYSATMATLLRLGEWLDYLKENGVYDNTRIIITADHGMNLGADQDEKRMLLTDDGEMINTDYYRPLMLYKDFDSEGFTISDEFMTNADLPTLAVQNLLTDARNPFTGKEITNQEKTVHEQYITISTHWRPQENEGNTFTPSTWLAVDGNCDDIGNWRYISEITDNPCGK